MIIKRKREFDNISQRILYGYNFAYSDFEPKASELADESDQKLLHSTMGTFIDELYINPGLLDMPLSKDESYEWYVCNNQKPELDAVYLDAFKILYKFYYFLYHMAERGNIISDSLICDMAVLRERKVVIKPAYTNILQLVGITLIKNKNDITLTHQNGDSLFRAMKLLSHLKSLFDFICCNYTGNHIYLLYRIDDLCGYNGLLKEMEKHCIDREYQMRLYLDFGQTNFNFRILFTLGVGGFNIGYNPRKYQQFYFATQNGIGVKAMLADFEMHPVHIQKYLLDTCKRCTHCHGCTHGGRIKGGKDQNAVAKFNGETIDLCTMFPIASWPEYSQDLITTLFDFHDLQNTYQNTKK